MKNTIALMWAAALPLFLSSCSKKPDEVTDQKNPVEVTGQVFVVTNGQQSIKMAIIPVHVISDEDFKKISDSVSRKIRENITKNSQEVLDEYARIDFINNTRSMETPDLNVPELPALLKEVATGSSQIPIDRMLADRITINSAVGELIGAMPPAVTKTNIDGQFSVPLHSKSWIVAYGERSLGIGKKEIYLWVTPCDLAKGAARPPLLISNDSDYADLDKMYALLASVAGKSDELLLHQAKEVSPSLAKWLEDANGRRDAAIQAAKVRRDAAIQAAKEKVEQERVIAVRQRDEVRNRLTQEVEAGAVGKAFQFPLPGNFSIKFMYCPAGKFIMGCPNPKELYPEGAHQVQVTISKGFWLASTELTQAQWLAVMGRTQSEMTQSEWSAIMSRPNATIYRENRSEFKGNSLPVNALDFYGAEEFIASLNDLELAPRGWKFALPTEAQWEYACRAGTTTALNNGKNLTSLEGPCSNLDEVAWYSQNSDGKPHSVGTKKPNAWGLYDMLGNVSEWCLDGHERALKGGTDPVAAPQKGSSSERVVRGGSFTARGECRSDYRGGNNKGYNHSYMGFRPILVPSE